MKELTTEEVRECQLSILKYIDQICRENKIEYTLIGGSLLGSIRHGGFIPWDGDIDIALRREQYEKLMPILSQKNENFELHYYKNNIDYQNYAKLYDNRTILKSNRDQMYNGRIGVHVDIFPYDKLPEGEENRKRFMKEVFKKSEALAATGFPAYISGTKWYYQFARVFLRLPLFLKYHGKNHEVAEEMDQLMKKYENIDAKELAFLSSKYFDKEHFPKEIFDEYEDIKFEGLKVRKIKNHEIYLKQLFGDFMKLPPEKDRKDHDFYHWYWDRT
ncbi:LicD family protein [Lactococcus lactis subsp. lactis]|uniref:LicD family protein n=1 Tax=Lactococcus lactis TaxID=1358 RepID=UPI00223BECD7|nr:LicD family protein [Lactococcus lactis]MCT0016666.1 LicD family protein [Lactococcus lactis subsp. lactis]